MRSLANPNNFAKLEALIASLNFKPDIVSITETWIVENQPGHYNNLQGYSFISNNRSKYRGGGVGLYIKSNLNFHIKQCTSIMEEKIFESLFVTLEDISFNTTSNSSQSSSLICGVIYRSPGIDPKSNLEFRTHLSSVLDKLETRNSKCIIMGDFNYDLINENNTNTNDFIDLMHDYCYQSIIINKPTRITDTSATAIDHIWTTINSSQIKAGIITDPISDHLPIIQAINLKINNSQSNISSRNFSQKNIINFNGKLADMDISKVLQETEPNLAYSQFQQQYMTEFNSSFPETKVNKSDKSKWFTKDLYLLNRTKQKLFKKYLQRNTEENKKRYNAARNKYHHAVINGKREHYRKLFSANRLNMKATWKSINSLLGKIKTQYTKAFVIDGKPTTDPLIISNKFNDHFFNIAADLVKQIPPTNTHHTHYLSQKSQNSIFICPTTPTEIKNIIMDLKSKSSCGMDGIP
uniref:uncharacterized protein LOC104265527 n=1 Tax=Ciona intestinalis TaxID=7719 RepID=UPI000521885F